MRRFSPRTRPDQGAPKKRKTERLNQRIPKTREDRNCRKSTRQKKQEKSSKAAAADVRVREDVSVSVSREKMSLRRVQLRCDPQSDAERGAMQRVLSGRHLTSQVDSDASLSAGPRASEDVVESRWLKVVHF